MFGWRAGRGGTLLDLAGIVDNPAETRIIPDHPADVIQQANEAAVELARRHTDFLTLWHPLLLGPLAAGAPRGFLDAARATAACFNPGFYAVFFMQRLSALASGDPDQLSAHVAEFDTALGATEISRLLSPAAASRIRNELRPYPRLQLQLARHIAAEQTP